MKSILCLFVIVLPLLSIGQSIGINSNQSKNYPVEKSKNQSSASVKSSSSSLNFKTLKIGDKVPDIEINNIINSAVTSTKFSSLKGRLIILDFWSRYCSSCIEAMPKMGKLQNQFKDDVSIITVTSESKSLIQPFIRSNKILSTVTLPFAIEDKKLRNLFPYLLVPHLVWIDSTGIVKAITGSSEVTAANISGVIANKNFSLSLKTDQLDYDYKLPLLLNKNGGDENKYKYRFIISGYLEGLPSVLSRTQNLDTNSARIFATNASILSIYKWLLNFNSSDNFIALNVKDSCRFLPAFCKMNVTEWQQKNFYCYDFIFPVEASKKAAETLLTNLNNFFRLKGGIEKRTVRCLLLRRTDTSIDLTAKHTTPEDNLYDDSSERKYLYNKPVSSLTEALNQIPGMPPVFNETDATANIDMVLNDNLSDLAKLRKALAGYGLELIEGLRTVDMLVLTEL